MTDPAIPHLMIVLAFAVVTVRLFVLLYRFAFGEFGRILDARMRDVAKTEIIEAERGNNDDSLLLRELYDRLELYFIQKRPYLDSELTMADVTSALLTNRSYLSQALHDYGGMNFCRYVNRYRAKYAMELFRNDMTLKTMDLCQMSGFTSRATFTVSFKDLTTYSPRDWCLMTLSEKEHL